jgi:hypothetical protein
MELGTPRVAAECNLWRVEFKHREQPSGHAASAYDE